MANEVTITSVCKSCNGTGIDSHYDGDGIGGLVLVEQDCVNCGATGVVSGVDGLEPRVVTISGEFFDDLMDKINDLIEKVDEIKEVVDGL